VFLLPFDTIYSPQARAAARLAEHQAAAEAATQEAAQREHLTARTRTQLERKLGVAIK
jgi:hypothetical protein